MYFPFDSLISAGVYAAIRAKFLAKYSRYSELIPVNLSPLRIDREESRRESDESVAQDPRQDLQSLAHP